MADENLLVTLEASLSNARATRARSATRLQELEAEAEKVRAEIAEMDTYAAQTEATLFRLLHSRINPNARPQQPTDTEIEAALQQDTARTSFASMISQPPAGYAAPPQNNVHSLPSREVTAPSRDTRETSAREYQPLQVPPPPLSHIEPTSERFLDRTIPQATALLLKEAAAPLHVNEIYNRLLEGGFQFTGNNPTISIAVSLNRNRRFRKVAPGTFELAIKDARETFSQVM